MTRMLYRLALTALLTVGIWWYADQVGETTERVTVQFSIREDAAWYVSPRGWPCATVVRGTRRGIQALIEKAPGGTLLLDQPPEALGLSPGERFIDVGRVLANSALFRDLGLVVEECDPGTMTLEVDRFEMHPVPVEVRPLGAVQSIQPSEVTVRIPSRVWEAHRDSLIARGSLDGLLSTIESTGPVTRLVPVTLPESLPKDYPITVEPRSVNVRFQVRERRSQVVFNLVPVWITKPLPVQHDWVVSALDNEFQTVTLDGPAEIMQRLHDERREVWLELVLRSDDLSTGAEAGERMRRPLRLALPEWAVGVRLAPDQKPTVEFEVARRPAVDMGG